MLPCLVRFLLATLRKGLQEICHCSLGILPCPPDTEVQGQELCSNVKSRVVKENQGLKCVKSEISHPFFSSYFIFGNMPACVLSCFSPIQLCNLMDCSPPGSSVHGLSQARILEWVVISSSWDLPDPGSNLCLLRLLHWQADSLSLSHQASKS